MTNLRPPTRELLTNQSHAEDDRVKTQQSKPWHGTPVTLFIAIGAVVILALGLGVATGGALHAPPPTAIALVLTLLPPSPTAPPTAVPLTPTPDCLSAATWIDTVSYHTKRADWAIAAKNAEAALSEPRTCITDKQTLANLLIESGLQDIYNTKFVPLDTAAQLGTIDHYRSLKRRASDLDVDFPTALQVATQAYTIDQFPLAKVAFEDALLDGSFTPADQTLLQNYSSTLYNIGVWWTSGDPQSSTYTQGLRMLATSYHIDVQYGTGLGEAEALLQRLLGKNKWPEPLDTPLLKTRIGG